jgi:pyruvate dehydrogenase E2 component (dihydrolipoamide acetyltransferase)
VALSDKQTPADERRGEGHENIYSDDGAVVHDHVNIGFAVAEQDALLVPIVADSDLKSLGRITRESRALAERARGGQVTAAEFDGGTFTISNLGRHGALECIPVINGSQAAILGVGAVRTEPVVTDGELAVGERMRLTVACDHRILHGADAAQFLDAVRSVLEHPLSLAL